MPVRCKQLLLETDQTQMKQPAADPRHERARVLYAESDLSQSQIARSLKISPSTLRRWAETQGWPARKPRSPGRNTTLTAAPNLSDEPTKTETGKADDAEACASEPTPEDAAHVTGTPIEPAEPKRKRRRAKRPRIGQLVDRLYCIITQNLEDMESRMNEESEPAAKQPDQVARVVGNLVRSIEKLKELEPEQSKRDNAAVRYPLTPEEEDRLRDRIVEKLVRLRERYAEQKPGE